MTEPIPTNPYARSTPTTNPYAVETPSSVAVAPPPVPVPVPGGQGFGGPEPPPGTIPPKTEPGFLENVGTAITNIPGSAYKVGEGLVQAVANPQQTGETIGSLIQGGLSKVGHLSDEQIDDARKRLALLEGHDPDKPVFIHGLGTVIPKNLRPTLEQAVKQGTPEYKEARDKIEANFDQMKDFYVDRYGSLEGFKKALIEDPVGVLLDATTVLTGVGGVARGVGAVTSRVGARTVGEAVTKAGELATKAGQTIDPINQAINVGTWTVGKVVPTVAKEVVGATTGAGGDAFSEAFRVARERAADPSNVSAATAYKNLSDAMAGTRTMEETVALANTGIKTMKVDAQRAYDFSKTNPTNGWYHDATVLNTQPVRDAWNRVYKTLFGKNGEPIIPLDQLKKIEEIGDTIAKWEMGNTSGHTLGGFDDLKRTIENSRGGIDDGHLNRVVTALTKEAKGVAAAHSDTVYRGQPNLYRESLKGYEKTMGELDEIERSLGVGRKQTSVDSAARKLTSVMRNNVNTNFGQRVKNVETLERAGSIDILPEIAGHALNTWSPRGIMRTLMGAGLTMAPTLGMGIPFASPKLMGHFARKLGTMTGLLDAPARDVGTVVNAVRPAVPAVGGPLTRIGQGEYGTADTPPLARGGALRRASR